MTPRKKWPEHCETARMNTISAIDRVIRLNFQIIERVGEVEVIRTLTKSNDILRQAQTELRECKNENPFGDEPKG